MKTFLLMISTCFLFLVACGEDNKKSVKLEDGEAYLTYSIANSYGWSSVEPLSSNGAGECSLSGGKIIYTKKDEGFSNADFCYEAGTTPDCSHELYYIDFSVTSPELVADYYQCAT